LYIYFECIYATLKLTSLQPVALAPKTASHITENPRENTIYFVSRQKGVFVFCILWVREMMLLLTCSSSQVTFLHVLVAPSVNLYASFADDMHTRVRFRFILGTRADY
jgi:hypothetical protein